MLRLRDRIKPSCALAARAALICLLVTATARAQGLQTGTISGTVSDAQEAVLPGVTVTVTSPALQGSRVTVSDATRAPSASRRVAWT